MGKSLLDSAVRRRIVDELQAESGRTLTAGQVAEIFGVHTSTARFHLDQLALAGTVSTAYERRGVGRPRKVYFLPKRSASRSVERDHQSLQMLTGLLVSMLADRDSDSGRTPDQVGEAWARENVDVDASGLPSATPGEWLSKIAGLTDVLHDWGYVPAITTNADRNEVDVRLAHCPFRDLARANPAVVCGIHRGLIRGTMRKLGEMTTDIELLPFIEGDTCIAHLHRNADTGSEGTRPESQRRGKGVVR